jgi:hypothetical protein
MIGSGTAKITPHKLSFTEPDTKRTPRLPAFWGSFASRRWFRDSLAGDKEAFTFQIIYLFTIAVTR